MTTLLLLDEHNSEAIAAEQRGLGHDVVAAVSNPDLRGSSDPEVFRWAAEHGYRLVTEIIKDFRPLLLQYDAAGAGGIGAAPLLLVPPRRLPPGPGGSCRRDHRGLALAGCLVPTSPSAPSKTG